jgi:hypothetical protein
MLEPGWRGDEPVLDGRKAQAEGSRPGDGGTKPPVRRSSRFSSGRGPSRRASLGSSYGSESTAVSKSAEGASGCVFSRPAGWPDSDAPHLEQWLWSGRTGDAHIGQDDSTTGSLR